MHCTFNGIANQNETATIHTGSIAIRARLHTVSLLIVIVVRVVDLRLRQALRLWLYISLTIRNLVRIPYVIRQDLVHSVISTAILYYSL